MMNNLLEVLLAQIDQVGKHRYLRSILPEELTSEYETMGRIAVVMIAFIKNTICVVEVT